VPHSPRWYHGLRPACLCHRALRKRHLAVTPGPTARAVHGSSTEPVIFCFWHNRLALTTKAYYGFVRKNSHTAGLAAMVSASKDGALLAAILERFKFQPVRGSSSRRGRQAFTGADHLGRARLRPGYHTGWTAWAVLRDPGRRNVPAQITGSADRSVLLPCTLEVSPKTWIRFKFRCHVSRCE